MSRPEQVVLIVVVFGAGAAAGAARGETVTTPGTAVAWALAALVAVSISVHAINEYADAETDRLTRRTAFSGGSGALHDLGLPRSFAGGVAIVAAVVADVVAAVGWLAGAIPTVAVVLLQVGLVGGWLYSVGPAPFSRRGWGEVANALLGGLLLPLYGVAVVSGQVSGTDAALFVPFTLLAFVNLLETQWPDRAADRQVGKQSLVSRLDARQVRGLAALAVVTSYALVLVLAPTPLPTSVALASLVGLPLSMWGLLRLTRVETPLPSVLAMVVVIVAQGIAWALV